MTNQEPRRFTMRSTILALIKVHVVEMKSNFELQHLRNLPEQAACWVLERGIASCLNDDLEEQDRAEDQLVRLEQLQPMASRRTCKPSERELCRSQRWRSTGAIARHTESRTGRAQI